MMRFPLSDLLDPQECYGYLLRVLHPDGLKCKAGHALPPDQAPHDRERTPLVDYRCRVCGNVFNLFTDTVGRNYNGPVNSDTPNGQNKIEYAPCENVIHRTSKPRAPWRF